MALTSINAIYHQLISYVRHYHINYLVPRRETITKYSEFDSVFKHNSPDQVLLPGTEFPTPVFDAGLLLKIMHDIKEGKISIGGHLSNDESTGNIMVNISEIYKEQQMLKNINEVYKLLQHYKMHLIKGKEKDLQPTMDDMGLMIRNQLRDLAATDTGISIVKKWYAKHALDFPLDPVISAQLLFRRGSNHMKFKKANAINHKLK